MRSGRAAWAKGAAVGVGALAPLLACSATCEENVGLSRDAAAHHEAATARDAGSVRDTAVDARDARDAGGARDTGSARGIDAARDTGITPDTGAARDTGAPRDAGRDARPDLRDAGHARPDAHDASSPFVTVATSQCAPQYLALDDHDVYWLDQCGSNNNHGGVLKAPKRGGAPVTLAPAQPNPWNLAVGTDAVYWTLEGQLVSAPLTGIPDGGWVSYLVPADGGVTPGLAALAVDATHLFWSVGADDNGVVTDYVAESALDGSNITLVPSTGVTAPWVVALDCPRPPGSCVASHAYVTGTVGDAGEAWGLYALSLDGDGVTKVTSDLSLPPSSVAWTPTGLFWTAWETTTTGTPYVVMSSASRTPIARGEGTTLSVAADAENVYWVSYNQLRDGLVLKAPVGGGAVTTIASGQTLPSAIVVDDTYVYWANSGDPYTEPAGAIMRAPK